MKQKKKFQFNYNQDFKLVSVFKLNDYIKD